MNTIEKKTVTNDGVTLYYEVVRAGVDSPTLFLVHGIGGDVDAWQFMQEILHARGISTVAMDVRGHGYSDHPTSSSAYELSLVNDDISAILNAEQLSKVILVGHSGGAVIALNFATHHPERLSRLVLLAGSYCPPWYTRSRALKKVAHAIIAIGSFISPPPHGPWHSPYPKGKHHKEFELWGLLRTMYHNSLRSYLLTGLRLTDVDLESSLKEIAIPTLLVVGEHDSIFPVPLSERMHADIPHATLKIIAGANHVLPLNNPEETTEAILQFIQE